MSREAKRVFLVVAIVVVALLVGGAIYNRATEKTCSELSAERRALIADGDVTAQDYTERMSEINDERERQGCNS